MSKRSFLILLSSTLLITVILSAIYTLLSIYILHDQKRFLPIVTLISVGLGYLFTYKVTKKLR